MVKEVIHDPIFLGVKSEKATKEDSQVTVLAGYVDCQQGQLCWYGSKYDWRT